MACHPNTPYSFSFIKITILYNYLNIYILIIGDGVSFRVIGTQSLDRFSRFVFQINAVGM